MKRIRRYIFEIALIAAVIDKRRWLLEHIFWDRG